jgi:hypothetical protein
MTGGKKPGSRLLGGARRAAQVAVLILPLMAQRGGGRGRRLPDLNVKNVPYDGRFMLARLSFTTNSPVGYYYGGLPAWAHGYPSSERNLSKIMREITVLHPHIDDTNVIAPDDPQLYKYPVVYMAEPDYWGMNDKEAAALRDYLLKGGFIIFDDFRDDFRDNFQGWANFQAQMQRMIPQARFVDMDPKHPIFHSFYEIDSFDIVPQYYDRGRPIFRGLYEDNDPKKRLMVIVNFNTDVSNFWEFSATGFVPVSESNEAYKLGVNYLIYALTH